MARSLLSISLSFVKPSCEGLPRFYREKTESREENIEMQVAFCVRRLFAVASASIEFGTIYAVDLLDSQRKNFANNLESFAKLVFSIYCKPLCT